MGVRLLGALSRRGRRGTGRRSRGVSAPGAVPGMRRPPGGAVRCRARRGCRLAPHHSPVGFVPAFGCPSLLQGLDPAGTRKTDCWYSGLLSADTGRRLLCNRFGHAPPRTLSPGRLGRSPRAAAGARTGAHMGSTRVLQTPQSRTAGPRRWPVKPGVETTPDAVLRRSVSLKPAVMQPCAVRAHRCAPLACGARSARERTPLRHRGPTGSMRSYVKPCGRTPTRAVVRSSARSYLRAPPRYDLAREGTTARIRVRPRGIRYDRAGLPWARVELSRSFAYFHGETPARVSRGRGPGRLNGRSSPCRLACLPRARARVPVRTPLRRRRDRRLDHVHPRPPLQAPAGRGSGHAGSEFSGARLQPPAGRGSGRSSHRPGPPTAPRAHQDAEGARRP